jgi:hypothetical protein
MFDGDDLLAGLDKLTFQIGADRSDFSIDIGVERA